MEDVIVKCSSEEEYIMTIAMTKAGNIIFKGEWVMKRIYVISPQAEQ